MGSRLPIAPIANRRLATSFIAYRHRKNHIVLHRVPKFCQSPISQSLPCSFIYGRYLGSDMLLKSYHKKLSGPLFIAYRHCKKYIVLHRVTKICRFPISYDFHRIADIAIISSHSYAHITSLNLQCVFCNMGSTMQFIL